MIDRRDPDIRTFIDTVNGDWALHPPLSELTTAEARKVAEQVRSRWTAGGPKMAAVREAVIATAAGNVRVRIYRPEGVAGENAPALIYLHGGGFVFFSLDTHDRLMREYAQAGQFVVVGVDYPLSPEARYPVALDLIVALVRWMAASGDTLGIDPRRIAIGGDSAGANLALATCLKLRDGDANGLIRAILSNYGAFSGVCSDAAEAEFGGEGAVLTQGEMVYYFDQYLDAQDQRSDPYACPLVATNLRDLPATLFIIPELDILAEQSAAMANNMRAAGCDVVSIVYPGATHSFVEAMSISSLARSAIDDGASWLRSLLAQAHCR